MTRRNLMTALFFGAAALLLYLALAPDRVEAPPDPTGGPPSRPAASGLAAPGLRTNAMKIEWASWREPGETADEPETATREEETCDPRLVRTLENLRGLDVYVEPGKKHDR